jgi:probable F420-dependent oxidoreductase
MAHDEDLDFPRHADELRARIGPVGVWWSEPGAGPAAVERDLAGAIEQLGFSAFWYGETPLRKDTFAHGAILLAATSTLVVATGIANLYSRDPATMVAGTAALSEAFDDRFLLGLGVSHAPLVSLFGNQSYDKPLSAMRAYLEQMDEAPYSGARPAAGIRRVLAALRPKMLALAADRSAGAHPYFVPPEHTARAREVLGTQPWLAPEQAFVLETDADRARAIARSHMAPYLKLPNYVNSVRALGFGDDDVTGPFSDRLVDAIVAWGDPEVIAARVQAHLDAGADHVCLQPLPVDAEAGLAALRAVAPLVTGLRR